jgi:hypothetical protein
MNRAIARQTLKSKMLQRKFSLQSKNGIVKNISAKRLVKAAASQDLKKE